MAVGTITRNTSNSQGTPDGNIGALKVTSTDVVGDSSYPTGGSSKVTGAAGAPSEAYYDIPTSKLIVYTTAGQIANTTVLSASTFQVTDFGY